MASALWVVVLVWVTWLVVHRGKDDTDNKDKRSGLILYTDHGTGVQYVGTMWGSITPRLGQDGKPYIGK